MIGSTRAARIAGIAHALVRAERHPNAELLRALRDGIRQHGVDADGGHGERGHGEHRQHDRIQALLGGARGDPLDHRPQSDVKPRPSTGGVPSTGSNDAESWPPANFYGSPLPLSV